MEDRVEQERVYEIHRANLPKLEDRIAKLAAKAAKYGLPEPRLEIVSEGERKVRKHEESTLFHVQPVVNVRLTGEVPRLEGGWQLIAIIDHRGGPGKHGYILSQIPWTADEGIEVPAHYAQDAPWCDHCQTKRERSDTFVIRSETAEWKRVGRQCLKDYILDQRADQYARWLYDINSIPWSDYGQADHAARYWFDTRGLVAVAAMMIEAHGWTSKRDESLGDAPLSTATRVLDWIDEPEEKRAEVLEERHWQKADAARTWLTSDIGEQEREQLNGYFLNLLAAASRSDAHLKHVGLVVSLIPAWDREIARAEKAALQASRPPSEHVGKIGERLDLVLTVRRRVDIEVEAYASRYSEVLYITSMDDADGNAFLWKTTSKKMEEGRTYKVRGTVKAHDEYEGSKQTVLTRCKIACGKCGTDDLWWDHGTAICGGCNLLEKKSHLVAEEDRNE